jgi:hypothetical protein
VTPATAAEQPQPSQSSTHQAAMDSQTQDLLQVSRDLLQSIADRDWDKYAALCDHSLTAFEPEAGVFQAQVHAQTCCVPSNLPI